MTTTLAAMKTAQQQPNSAPVSKPRTIIDFLQGDKKIERAIAAVAGQYFTPDRFLRLAVNAIKKTPALAQCDANSVLGAFMTSAALGLEPNTVLQQAFLIPYKKRQKKGNDWVDVYECNFQVGARGFVTLAHRSPHVSTLEAEAIHAGDHFKHMKGSKSFLEFEKMLKDRGDMIGAFCFTKMADGNEQATVLPYDEIAKIRSRSETYQALARALAEAERGDDRKAIEKARGKFEDTPWVMWADDMAAKSAIKKHCKQLPISPGDALAVAAQLDSDDGRTIDMASMADPDMVSAVMKDGAEAAATGGVSSAEAFGVREQLEDAPSPTLQPMRARAANAETVEVHQQHADAFDQQVDQVEQQVLAAAAPTDERTPLEKFAHRLATHTDLDRLDADADLITSVTNDPGTQADMRNTYKARRAVLTGDEPKAEPTLQAAPAAPAARPPRPPRGQMSIE
jgi:phage RecT family recombinase